MNLASSSCSGSVQIINGFKAKIISLRLFMNIFSLALAQSNNPFKAIRYFNEIAKRRRKYQGYDKISRYVKCNGKYYWADQIPGWPSKNFDNFFIGELMRCKSGNSIQGQMNTIIFSITSRCGLQCRHCFEWDNLDDKEHLSIEALLEILEKVRTLGITHIQFGGGEPLARFNDLLSLIENAKPGMDCWILTSGFGLTSDKAFRLKEAGLTGASISLDHWEENAHNEFRNNEKSFYWVKEAIKNCNKAGIIVSLSVCSTREFVTPENLRRYLDLAKEWGAGFIRILEPRKTGRFKNEDVKLNEAAIKLLIDFYLESYREIKYRDHPIVMYPGYDQRQAGCLGAGNRFMYIDSKGDIHACPFCHGSVGNATEDDLEEAVSKLKRIGCKEYVFCSKDQALI